VARYAGAPVAAEGLEKLVFQIDRAVGAEGSVGTGRILEKLIVGDNRRFRRAALR
jgi:hypothetical protein